jgi:antitoxin PrlF
MGALRSKLTSKAQTVIPRAIRQQLGLAPGDSIVYRVTDRGVLIEKEAPVDDPFANFTEWADEADDAAYRTL